MTDFDPYYHWLGIAPKDQPPNHYRLLGIELFESNADVISNAADRQLGHIRSFQSGRHSALSQKLLNEIAAARLCLLDPQRKARYDQQLNAGEAGEGIETQTAAFGEYYLIDHIASSEKGQLYKAVHRHMGRVVALKVLSSRATQSAEAVARFERKMKLLARLSHPNLVTAYDAGEREGTHYLIMEYVDGCDLLQLMRRFGTLPVRHVVDYTLQAAAGLAYAHAQGIVHRNLKPSNLLVDYDGIVKVIGLGMALFRDEKSLSASSVRGRVLGTIDYMPPEQAVDSASVDQRADIYSLGCTLYTALTRRLPFPGKSVKKRLLAHRNSPIPSIRAVRGDVPELLDQILARMMAKRPEQRFPSMEEVAQALQMVEQLLLSGSAPPAAPPDGPLEAPPLSQTATPPPPPPPREVAAPPAPETIVAPPSEAPDPPAPGEELDSFLNNLSDDEPYWKRRK